MSLYTYVPGKAELLDLMFETAIVDAPVRAAGRRLARPARGPGPGRLGPLPAPPVAARRRHHPGAAWGPTASTPTSWPCRWSTASASTAAEMIGVVMLISGYVRGAAQAVADAAEAERATGISDDDWWNARSAAARGGVGPRAVPGRHPGQRRAPGRRAVRRATATCAATSTRSSSTPSSSGWPGSSTGSACWWSRRRSARR